MKEIWKDIPEFEGLYQASNLGRIKSLERINARGNRLKEKILKPGINQYGYYQVQLYKNSIGKMYIVHRLVWIAFNGPIPEGLQVNHINEIKIDNKLENLNLMTPKENTNWGTGIERRAKAVLQFTLDNIFVKEYQSTMQVARELGFSCGHICECCKGKRKTAHGFKWKYKE